MSTLNVSTQAPTDLTKTQPPSCNKINHLVALIPEAENTKYNLALISAGARQSLGRGWRMQDLVPWQDLYQGRRIKAECE